MTDDDFYLLINSWHEPFSCILPDTQWGERWEVVFDTVSGWTKDNDKAFGAGETVDIEGRSWTVLRSVKKAPTE